MPLEMPGKTKVTRQFQHQSVQKKKGKILLILKETPKALRESVHIPRKRYDLNSEPQCRAILTGSYKKLKFIFY